MKEKVLFIAGLVGSFSATTILLINHALVLLGVDTTGYAEIINVVGMVLAVVILIVAVLFLNKYNVIQQTHANTQNKVVTTALDGNANLMQTLLPKLANQILTAAEERGANLLRTTEASISNMMTKMLPELAEQTMQVVTQKSQNIVEETTAKANAVMLTMNDLLPTYAKNISEAVAQTVRENNAHYHKMLNDIKHLIPSLPTQNLSMVIDTEDLVNKIHADFVKLQQDFLKSMQPILVKDIDQPNLFTQTNETDEKAT